MSTPDVQPSGRAGSSAWPTVTIAIVAFDRRDELAVTLTTLFEELDYPSDRLDVVVVDNASRDGTAAMVRERFPDVRLVENAVNLGAPAWNEGFAAARGEYVVILDDDCSLAGTSLARAVEQAREHDADLVSFYVLSSGGDAASSFSRYSNTGLLSFWGCSALISRRALTLLGGYDPYIFLWGNEVELTMRLLDAGFAHVHLSDVTTVHRKLPGGWTLEGHRRNLRHFAYVAAKLLRPADAALALANLLLRVVLESVQRPGIIRLLPEVVTGARDGLRRRRPVRREVSRLYRRNFLEFVGPLRWARGPISRWRLRHVEDAAEADLERRRQRFYCSRPALYPTTTTSLRV